MSRHDVGARTPRAPTCRGVGASIRDTSGTPHVAGMAVYRLKPRGLGLVQHMCCTGPNPGVGGLVTKMDARAHARTTRACPRIHFRTRTRNSIRNTREHHM